MDVGIIGVGNMGTHMARRLAAAGHGVSGFDPRPDIQERLAEVGGVALPSAAQVAATARVTVLMVLDDRQAEATVWGEGGVAEGAGPDSVLLVMSSLTPSWVEGVQARDARRFQVVDAPVSGGVEAAKTGSLTIMAAGDDRAIQTVQPVLDALGTNIIRVGDRPGLGATMKAINQAMYFSAFASAAEMVVTGARAGLDPDTIIDVVGASSGGSWALRHRVPLAWRNGYRSGGSLAIAAKDLGTALGLADELGTNADVTRAVAALVADALREHDGAGDDPLIVEAVERLSGFAVAARGAR
jgi:3-hydroxyisobutyrate dehydrogenase-like beta-hydroxyacid dehydrogenase